MYERGINVVRKLLLIRFRWDQEHSVFFCGFSLLIVVLTKGIQINMLLYR